MLLENERLSVLVPVLDHAAAVDEVCGRDRRRQTAAEEVAEHECR
jgi:hypothetical protein